MVKITKVTLITWGVSASHKLGWKASSFRSVWPKHGKNHRMEGNLFKWYSKGDTDPDACSCLEGINSACSLWYNQHRANIFLLLKISLPVKGKMATGTWLQHSIKVGTGLKWKRQTYVKRVFSKTHLHQTVARFLWFFKRTPNLEALALPLSLALCFSLLTWNLLIFFSHQLKNINYHALYIKYSMSPTQCCISLCVLSIFATWGQYKWVDLPRASL